jgi:hypothetical protein
MEVKSSGHELAEDDSWHCPQLGASTDAITVSASVAMVVLTGFRSNVLVDRCHFWGRRRGITI